MASGWNPWVWLECIGVVSGWCCKAVIDIFIIIITFPYSTCISSFFGSSIPTSLFIFKMFFVLVIFVQYSKHCSKNIRDRKKNRDHVNRINYIDKNVECTSTAHLRESRDFHVRGTP